MSYILDNQEVTIQYSKYCEGDKLAVVLLDKYEQMYGVLSVNLIDEQLTNKNCAFIDTNNVPQAEEFLKKYNIAKPTGKFGFSGFCTYPEYEFKKEDYYV